MSTPTLMHQVDDGIVFGAVERTRQRCGPCGHHTMCLYVTRVELPQGIEARQSLILVKRMDDTSPQYHQFVGIGCGCYAKFHRQLAHIADLLPREKRRG